MYDDDYDEEEIERFGKEGGEFLLKNKIICTDDIEEVRRFKKEIEEEEIEKIGYENGLKKKFSFVKLNKRSDKKMDYIYDDSANNDDNEELEDLVAEFLDEEIDEDLEKARKKMPQKLVNGLKEAFKILNEHKDYLDEDLKNAMQYISRILTKYPEPGKYPYPEKYPYPKKVKKAMDWQGVQDLLFGGHIPADDDEIEKSSKANPFPSIAKAIKIKGEAIDELEEELEEENFDPDDRRI